MVIDPRDPFRGLMITSNPTNPPVVELPTMWGGISSLPNPLDLLRRLRDPSPRFDDFTGRDVLYPVVAAEPSATSSATATATPTSTATPRSCAGDCNQDGMVTVDEILVGVSMALGERAVQDCPQLDVDDDGFVTVDEILKAISLALSSCSR